jgi:hypothetical protein
MSSGISPRRLFLFVMVTVLVLLLGLALVGYLTGNWNEDESLRPGYGLASAESYEITKYEGEMLKLERDAIDEAFKNQVVNVFAVWMRDASGQPARAITGVTQARKAFAAARARIDEREEAYKRSKQ